MSLARSFGLLRNSRRLFCNTKFAGQAITDRQSTNEDIVTNRPRISQPDAPRTKSSSLLIPPTLVQQNLRDFELERLRVVPVLNTFYGGNPVHEDNLNNLNRIIRKYINLPTKVVDDKDSPFGRFMTFEEYQAQCQSGTRLRFKHHKELTTLLQRLKSIDKELMPKEVIDVLKAFSSSKGESTKAAEQKMKTLDAFGRSFTVGGRKRSLAYVYLVKGEGQTIVNGESLTKYFPKDTDRKKIAYPFQVVEQEGQFNIFAEVNGGGLTGQVEAIMYAIAKGLVVHNPLFKSRLHKAGLMTRDTRKVERKKPGLVKARKAPTWVKR